VNQYPLPYTVDRQRQPEEGALQVDITATGTARARKRHSRYQFAVDHKYLSSTEADTLQTYCEAHEGELVTLTWTDGHSYEGLLTDWSVRRTAGPRSHASVAIRGARRLP